MALAFNDVSGGLGICQEVDDLCDSDVNSYPLVAKARRANTALEDLELKMLMADGTWQFDDANYSSLPTGLQSFVDGQAEYSYDATLLFIERIEILLKDGITWLKLDSMDEIETPFTQTDLAVQATPSAYYKRGNKFGFNNVPKSTNVTLTNGIKVFFKRTASLFAASDTTKVPGIPSPFHILVAQKTALPYCKTYKKDRVAQLVYDIAEGEKQLKAYVANRGKDEPGRMTMKRRSFR